MYQSGGLTGEVSLVTSRTFFFLMVRRPPRSTRTDTLFPYTTLFRSLRGASEEKPCSRPAPLRVSASPREPKYLTRRRGDAERKGDGACGAKPCHAAISARSEEHTSELQSLMRISYAVFCLKKQRHIPHNKKTIMTTSLYQMQARKPAAELS